jgi:hypothetical protein
MTLATIRADFQQILNRSDCTDDQANGYIVKALRRIQRECRLPSMEKMIVYTATTVSLGAIALPADILQIIDVMVPAAVADTDADVAADGELALDNAGSYRALQTVRLTDPPSRYARYQSALYVRGAVPIGSYARLLYYGNLTPFATDSSDNEISASTPDLLTYGALAFAGPVYMHPQAVDWETAYQSILTDTIQMGQDLDASGGPAVIAPTYRT